MKKEKTNQRGTAVRWVSTVLVLVTVLVALFLIAWFMSPRAFMAVPFGFLFGFILQKGFLCPASACSEVLLFRSWEKLAGLFCCIVTSMAGYALLDLTGWVTLQPPPLNWLNLAVGGVLFGTGMVLAGGCIAGSLFKAGTGNLNSLAALPAILLGAYLVHDGWLHSLDTAFRNASGKEWTTLMGITGMPYPVLAGITVVVVLIAVVWRARGAPSKTRRPVHFCDILYKPWKPWKAGVAIGILAPLSCLAASATGYYAPLGATDGVLNTLDLVMGISGAFLWPVLFCAALIAGSWFSGRLSGQSRLLPKPRDEVGIAFLGGLLLGMGAAFADGCFYGNIVSGWALLHVSGFLFAVVTIPAAWVTTYLYLLGGPAMGRNRKASG